jgi:hypothetical protein
MAHLDPCRGGARFRWLRRDRAHRAQWVRTGHPGKGWFRRALDQPVVELTRGGLTTRRVVVPVADPPVVRAVNGAFTAKYGAADWIVALSGDAAERVPVRLDPVAGAR